MHTGTLVLRSRMYGNTVKAPRGNLPPGELPIYNLFCSITFITLQHLLCFQICRQNTEFIDSEELNINTELA